LIEAEIEVGKRGISMGVKSLERLGWFGKLILDYREIVSQQKFILSIEDNLRDGNKLHIPVKMAGTITLRCSSGNLEEKT
jgi:hypothetical protein